MSFWFTANGARFDCMCDIEMLYHRTDKLNEGALVSLLLLSNDESFALY